MRTIHTFVRKARANKGKAPHHRLHPEGTALDKMRLKDSLFEGRPGGKAEHKKDRKLKKLSLGGEKRVRIKRSKSPKLPKGPEKLKRPVKSETDSETGPADREEPDTGVATSDQGPQLPRPDLKGMLGEESTQEAEMSSSEGETWIADEDIMVESGESPGPVGREGQEAPGGH